MKSIQTAKSLAIVRNSIFLILYIFLSLTTVAFGQEACEVIVLGIAQDAGYPQINCQKECCRQVWNDPVQKQMVASLAIIDTNLKKYWIIDATPDFKEQINLVQKHMKLPGLMPEGIILTHAHIGHYTGLMDLGREAMGAKGIKVYVMPKMEHFLETNGPWSQLVDLKNIQLQPIQCNSPVSLSDHLTITSFEVPHRDEFSETVGYKISSGKEEIIYIPDIDKWDKWDQSLIQIVNASSSVIIDGTFYQNGEIPGRDMSEIPHPFVEETIKILEHLPIKEKKKVHFIHLNHTNPLLQTESSAYKEVTEEGFRIAHQGMVFKLE